MGNSKSSLNLTDDAIQSIVQRTRTSDIFESVLYVDKRWNRIARRNVIWIPRYALLTGIRLDPADYQEYEVFPLFMKVWLQYPHVWMDEGKVVETSENIVWIDAYYGSKEMPRDNKDFVVVEETGDLVGYDGLYWTNQPDLIVLTTVKYRNPRLYYILRRKGQKIVIHDVTSLLQIHESPLDILGDKMLGQGSYNCVVLTSDNRVLRMADVSDPGNKKIIVRGASIVHFLQRYKVNLGPSLLKEIKRGYETDRQPVQCIKSPGPFFVQQIEYLDGPKKMDSGSVFCLVWFFYVANSLFKLRHGDFKPANMGYRNLEQPETKLFQLYDIRYAVPLSESVPVVIDFDFASVDVTRQKFFGIGTPETAPPEAVINTVINEWVEEPLPIGPYPDWWSLGATLFLIWVPDFRSWLNESRQNKYSRAVWREIAGVTAGPPSAFVIRCISSVYAHVMMHALVMEEPLILHRYFFEGAPLKIVTEDAIQMIQQHKMSFWRAPWKKALLSKLLSWHPEKRPISKDDFSSLFPNFADSQRSNRGADYHYGYTDTYRNQVFKKMDKKKLLKQSVY